MWNIPKRTTRRLDIRRSKVERYGPWYVRVPRRLGPGATFVIVASALVIGGLIALAPEPFPYREHMSVARPLGSRVRFSIEDQQQTLEQRMSAKATAPNYFRLNQELLESVRGALTGVLTLAKAHGEDSAKLIQEARSAGFDLDGDAVSELLRELDNKKDDEFVRAVDRAILTLRQAPLVEPYRTEARRTAAEAVLVSSGDAAAERRVPATALVFASDSDSVSRLMDDAVRHFAVPLRHPLREVLLQAFKPKGGETFVQPLYRYDGDRSNESARLAAAAVPQQFRIFDAGAMLADAGELSSSEIDLLLTEHRSYQDALRGGNTSESFLAARLSRGGLGLCAVIGWWLYLLCTDPKVARNPARLAIAVGLVAISVGGAIFHSSFSNLPYGLLTGSQTVVAGAIGLLLTLTAGLSVTGLASVLTVVVTHSGSTALVSLMAVSIVMVIAARDIRYRGRLILVGALAAVAVALTTMAGEIVDGQLLSYSLTEGAWAAGATLFAAFIVEGLVPLIERLFGVATSMTLLEWCDANKPLLRTMAAEAPGTYNHSLMVGTLAEAAASAIGANGLLARAGAYYHDIGKIHKPEYFVENQMAGVSRHERLSPAMSLLIIVGHVKDGIETAREYRVPQMLHSFIMEHHGTTLVEYFYHAARSARKPGDPAVTEMEFRYPGPKPQSRETAVLMLCDSVEGAVRAMPEPTPSRIETLVSDLVRKRLLDGQFDECDLTFRELAAIEKSLVKTLCGIYHARIAYPERETERDSGSRRAS